MYSRRDFLRSGTLAAGALALGPAYWRAMAASVQPGAGPYGPLGAPDSNGIRLPSGFRSRIVAMGGQPVPGTAFVRPAAADGGATFASSNGSWILVHNSELPLPVDEPRAPTGLGAGGATAIRFDSNARIVDAYRILGGTTSNCAGGPTPWGTWLSCEENPDGLVWECDPTGARPGVQRPALGVFKHEAVCVDPGGQRLYLTEDLFDGCFYRFTPTAYPDLSSGVLEVAIASSDGRVTWRRVPNPQGGRLDPTRNQVSGATRFRRGEGIYFDDGVVYIATTADSTIHGYNTRTERIDIVYAASDVKDPPLKDVDNVTVTASGDIYVCEDDGAEDPLDIAIITPEGEVARFLKVTGNQHSESELSGVTFDPSGSRMYFNSQRAFGQGITYEVTGPFRTQRPRRAPPPGTLGLEIPRRIAYSVFRKRGLPVAVTTDTPVSIRVRVRRGVRLRGRRRQATLASRRVRLRRGRTLMRVKMPRGRRRRVRLLRPLVRALRRSRTSSVPATVIVELRVGGRRRVLRRKVLITRDPRRFGRGRRRRRRRRH
jgi:uncharacterized protein